ncbi:MAG: hypothetical protein GY774_21205 [Planctomycetes bacterium]|nr:hypothetical protein [Planctomycetota bacterium]
MKNTYRVILIGLVMLGVVYASTGQEEKTKEVETKTEEVEKKTEEGWKKDEEGCKYKPIDLCKFSVSMKVGHYVQLKECHKREIELKQVDCREMGRDGRDFPCYQGSEVFEVRANFPAIFNATIDKSSGDEEILEEVNLYWENGVNTIQGCSGWEELTLCLDAWGVDLWMFNVGTIKVGDITIGVKPPDTTNDDTKDDKESDD